MEEGIEGLWGTLSPIGRRVLLTRHFDNSLSVYLFLEFEPKLGKSEKFNNQGTKGNKAFRIPFITKQQLKIRQPLHKIFLKPWYKLYKGPQSSILTHPFLMFPLFQKYLNPQCCLLYLLAHTDALGAFGIQTQSLNLWLVS